jgi:hypothetical protein
MFDERSAESIVRAVFHPRLGPWDGTSSRVSLQSAKTFRTCLGRAISSDSIASIHLPIMVDAFTRTMLSMRDRAAHDEWIDWQREARSLVFGVAARAVLGNLLTAKDIETLESWFQTYAVGLFKPVRLLPVALSLPIAWTQNVLSMSSDQMDYAYACVASKLSENYGKLYVLN